MPSRGILLRPLSGQLFGRLFRLSSASGQLSRPLSRQLQGPWRATFVIRADDSESDFLNFVCLYLEIYFAVYFAVKLIFLLLFCVLERMGRCRIMILPLRELSAHLFRAPTHTCCTLRAKISQK